MSIVATATTSAPTQAAEALFKEARRRRRRRRAGWGLAVLLVVASLVVLAATLQTVRPGRARNHAPASRQAPAPARVSSEPADIVGWTSGSTVVVLSTRTGRVLRTLADNVSIFAPGIPNVSVAPDGTVFFESATPSAANTDVDSGDQIFSVPISGGRIRHLGAGSDPQVSPSGGFLAFISPNPAGQSGEAPYLVPPMGIDIASLSSGLIGAVKKLAPGPDQLNQAASDLSWSSDSRYLSFDLLDPTTNLTTSWTVRTTAATSSLAAATEIPLQPSSLTWNGYWGKSRRGVNIGLGVLFSQSGKQEVVTINPATGRVVDRLFAVPGEICTETYPAAANGCFSLFSNDVIGDSAGTDVLVAGAISQGRQRSIPSGEASLYRWKVGDHVPVKVATQILVASWGPGSN